MLARLLGKTRRTNNIWREIFMPASNLRKVIQKSSYHFAGILKTMRVEEAGFLSGGFVELYREWKKRLLYLPKYFRFSLRAAKQKHFLNYYFRTSSRWGESGCDVTMARDVGVRHLENCATKKNVAFACELCSPFSAKSASTSPGHRQGCGLSKSASFLCDLASRRPFSGFITLRAW